MTQVKLTRVWIGTQETQYGVKDKCSIKCEQLGDEWLSTLKVTANMKKWAEGDVVEINVTKKKSKDGQKTFYNFEEGMNLGGLSESTVKSPPLVTQKEEEEIDITKEFIF